MAIRPVFVPCDQSMVMSVDVNFDWHAGRTPADKKFNVASLHQAAQTKGLSRVLEVSTKSDRKIGRHLSAFNLKTIIPATHQMVSVESMYQGCKVFENGGPYTDIIEKSSRDAKRDARLKESGALTGFTYFGVEWMSDSLTSFYDWLYLSALRPHQDYLRTHIMSYDGFTDIEFNPARSVACQARTCAMLVTLLKNNALDRYLDAQAVACFKA